MNSETIQAIAVNQSRPNTSAAIVPARVLTRSPDWRCCQASFLHRADTSGGISLMARAIRSGRMSRSSSWPKNGMKSGIRSMGLTAYATATIMTVRARNGVRGSFHARNKAHIHVNFVRAKAALLGSVLLPFLFKVRELHAETCAAL